MDSQPIIDYAMTQAMVTRHEDRVFGYAYALGLVWGMLGEQEQKFMLDFVATKTKEND